MELPALSKRKMRKIKEEGPYAGKNILVFDAEGKAVPKSSLSKSQTNQYFQALVKSDKGKEKVLQLQPDEAESDDGEYLTRVRKNMDENRDLDD